MRPSNLWLRSGIAFAILGGTFLVARAVPTGGRALLLQTQRDQTVTALETAIARGDDGIGPLPGNFVEDDADEQEDDPLVRALWLRLNNGPVSQQSVMSLLHVSVLLCLRVLLFFLSSL